MACLRRRGTPCTPPPTKKRRAQRCHQVNRTGPFPAGSPGVVESGLKASERVSSSRRMKERVQRSNCEGWSSWRRPERIDYSQTIMDNIISVKGFRTNRILQEVVKRITIKYMNSKRLLSMLKQTRPFCNLSVSQLILLT